MKVVRHGGYTVAYSANRRAPLWVCEQLRAAELAGPLKKSFALRRDPLLGRVSQPALRDFQGSGFAPLLLASAHHQRLKRALRQERFYLSNVVALRARGSFATRQKAAPRETQYDQLAEGVRGWADKFDRIWVITGPIFAKRPSLIGRQKLHVPSHFFKILARRDKQSRWRWLAFVVPNDAGAPSGELTSFRRSIRWIEQQTGLRFFSRLDEDAVALKKLKIGEMWPARTAQDGAGGAMLRDIKESPPVGIGARPSGWPRVTMSRASVEGGLDAATIRRVIRREFSKIKDCYIRIGLMAKPKLRGLVRIRFTIDPEGRVDSARILRATLRHKPTHRCLLKAVRSWRFPKPEGSKPKVEYPFFFAPTGG
ncbi:MAG: TonB family protein [bacterium]